MQRIVFDSGIREYQLGNGVLRFNPGDPNVYARFMKAGEKITAIESALVEKGKAIDASDEKNGAAVLQLMAEADKEVKQVLNWIFGAGNDFDQMLGGVNLLGVGDNGERVITNLFAALTPIIQDGAQKCAKQQIGNAVGKAKINRAGRRAQK